MRMQVTGKQKEPHLLALVSRATCPADCQANVKLTRAPSDAVYAQMYGASSSSPSEIDVPGSLLESAVLFHTAL